MILSRQGDRNTVGRHRADRGRNGQRRTRPVMRRTILDGPCIPKLGPGSTTKVTKITKARGFVFLRVLRALRGATRFMESLHGSRIAHWVPEPVQLVGRALRCAPALEGAPSRSLDRAAGKGLPALFGSWRAGFSKIWTRVGTMNCAGNLPRRSRRARRPEDLCSFVSFVLFVVQLRSWRGNFSKVWTRIGTLNRRPNPSPGLRPPSPAVGGRGTWVECGSWRAGFSKIWTRIGTMNHAGIYHEGHEDHEGRRICVPSCPSCSSWFHSVHGEPGFPKFGHALGP